LHFRFTAFARLTLAPLRALTAAGLGAVSALGTLAPFGALATLWPWTAILARFAGLTRFTIFAGLSELTFAAWAEAIAASAAATEITVSTLSAIELLLRRAARFAAAAFFGFSVDFRLASF
jgi:hypothetical protein